MSQFNLPVTWSDRVGQGRTGSDRVGQVGQGRIGSDRVGQVGQVGQGWTGLDRSDEFASLQNKTA
ncbi:MAG: hypothetical protein GX561_05660 [Lentisphaerae bacterium]|jgi:hypothetical protein|nr:hypothetical protein [Lentisphaerota bacterium]